MTAGPGQGNERKKADAADRAIDGTLESALHAHTVDLRERVLARLDEPARPSPAWWQPLARPALLPVAGAVLLAIGVIITWQHADETLTRIGTRQPTASVARAKPGAAHTRPGVAPAPKAGDPGASADRRRLPLPPSPFGLRRTGAPRPSSLVAPVASDQVILAASVLEMDAMSASAHGAVESASKGDDAGPALPGAPAGDLGDPIKPMPPIRPIVIQPISPAPILDAPPVSTLAQPVSTLSAGELSRDPSGPGNPGGVRP